jgi:hypothetical protein
MQNRRLVSCLLASSLVLGARAGLASVRTVPGIVNAGGLNNTRFVSDVTISNPGADAAQVTISFLPAESPNAKTVTLGPGETRVYRNVVDSLFGTSGAGALSISSGEPLLIRARTYNTASSGTYGVALPVYDEDRLLTPGEIADSLWVSQDASGSSGYRTNIALVFPEAAGGEATVIVFDADGHELGRKDYALDTAGLQQFSVGSFAGSVSVGRAQVHVSRGRAAGYSVVVDNVTGDSSLFTFEDLPGGRQDVLVNGVARANGRNGTFFRTDGRFYNPTGADVTVNVAFHAAGNANPSPATASFLLPAGKIRDVVDVLDSLLHLPVGSAGALRFQADAPVAILCRTSNVDPSGQRPGTFGAQQKPVQVLSFLGSGDAGAAITGIRQDAGYRTNVGFAAGPDGATFALSLRDSAGAQAASASGSLGPWGWTQPSVQDLFPGVAIPADATLKVAVTAGSVDVFDSSIDNLSGDPVVTPIAALPVSIPASATIGPQGGSIRSADGRLTLRIPAGALSAGVAVSLETSAINDAPQGLGASYVLSPGGLAFAKPVTLVFRYGEADTNGSNAGSLGIAYKSGASWIAARGGTVDASAHTLTVPIASTSPGRARALLADGGEAFAPYLAGGITPRNTAVPTLGKRQFSILVVGPSSSELGGSSESGVLEPTGHPPVTIAWYVDEFVGGNGLVGIVSDSGTTAQYTAPSCVPPGQFVNVTAAVRWGSQRLLLSARVRVMPRDWTFHATLVHDVRCPGTVADYVVYKAGFSFSLDDDLNIVEELPDLPIAPEYGGVQPCPGYTSATRTSNDNLQVDWLGGKYDPEARVFNAQYAATFPIVIGYTLTSPGGGHSTQAPVTISIPPIGLDSFPEGFNMTFGAAAGPVNFTLTYTLGPLHPGGCH